MPGKRNQRGLLWVVVALAMIAMIELPRARGDDTIFTPIETIDITHIRLDLAVDLKAKHVDATATLVMTPRRASSSVTLDAVDFEIKGVSGSVASPTKGPLKYNYDGKHLEVLFGRTVEPDDVIVIDIDYAIDKPTSGLHFFAPSDDTPDAPYQVWSQGQAIDNRYWFPSFDNPGEMQTSEVIATVDQGFQVLSNGVLESMNADTSTGKTTWHWSQKQPHVAYLVTLVVGKFHIVEDKWRDIPVTYWVPEDRVDDAQRSFGRTPAMLEFFSDKIGVKYAWPKYAQVCCYNYGGGMEHTSATTVGENTLHDARAHIDRNSDGLVSHELAHQWFGDLLTCREWAHIWLNEGFASYFEALWDEHDNGEDKFAYNMYQKASAAISGGKKKPIVDRHYKNPDEQFDSRAYPKGAWVLHMLRRQIGDNAFWRVINRHVTINRHKTVETSDFRKSVEAVTGLSFERFFYDWTERPGNPVLDVAYTWNEDAGAADVVVKQTQKAEAFHIPIELEFTAGGKPVTVKRFMTGKELQISVPLETVPTLLRVDPRNAVLRELTEHKPLELWRSQLKHDANPVGRIDAAKHLGKQKESEANLKALAQALKSDAFWAVRSEVAGVLGKMKGDVVRDALLVGVTDADSKVRRACVDALGKFEDDELVTKTVHRIAEEGDKSYQVEAAAISTYAKLDSDNAMPIIEAGLKRDSSREVLRNAALRALAKVGGAEAIDRLIEWAKPGKPYSCRQAAARGLGTAGKDLDADSAALTGVLDTLSDCLESGGRLRFAAASALGALGGKADPMLDKLRTLVEQPEGLGRARRAIERAIKAIEKDAPAAKKIAKLQEKSDEMQAQITKLKSTIATLEARLKKEAAHASSDADK